MPTGDNWTLDEVQNVVRDYFDMLLRELYDQPYSKTVHRTSLLPLLNGRSEGAVERKHQNISAVLIENGLPYIDGYKPLANYQSLLGEVVERHIRSNPQICNALTSAPALAPTRLDRDVSAIDAAELLADPPNGPQLFNRFARVYADGLLPDVVKAQGNNRVLHALGIHFILSVERKRLSSANRHDLALNVAAVPQQDGNTTGFDVRSFRLTDGEEMLLSVKTTALGKHFPFLMCSAEVELSRMRPGNFALYRVFSCGTKTRYFTIPGDVSKTCVMHPAEYLVIP